MSIDDHLRAVRMRIVSSDGPNLLKFEFGKVRHVQNF